MKKFVSSIVIKWLPTRLHAAIFTIKLYLKAPWLAWFSKSSFNTSAPPVVLLSFPRSGSSWIGSIMGSGNDIRYLREPVTTKYILNKTHSTKKRISVFDSDSCDNWVEYQAYINNSLAATPNFSHAVIPSPKQWKSPKTLKSLLVKEVNPLVVGTYLNKQVKLIYLVRHPCSVAKSYQALNWRSKDLFKSKLNTETLAKIKALSPNIQKADIWQQMGYLQGWIEATVKLALTTSNKPTQIVRYEDICLSPESEFKALFNFANINFSSEANERITNSLSRGGSVSAGDFSLTRNQAELTKIKIAKEEQCHYLSLMNAYHQAIQDFNTQVPLDSLSKASYPKTYNLVEFSE